MPHCSEERYKLYRACSFQPFRLPILLQNFSLCIATKRVVMIAMLSTSSQTFFRQAHKHKASPASNCICDLELESVAAVTVQRYFSRQNRHWKARQVGGSKICCNRGCLQQMLSPFKCMVQVRVWCAIFHQDPLP